MVGKSLLLIIDWVDTSVRITTWLVCRSEVFFPNLLLILLRLVVSISLKQLVVFTVDFVYFNYGLACVVISEFAVSKVGRSVVVLPCFLLFFFNVLKFLQSSKPLFSHIASFFIHQLIKFVLISTLQLHSVCLVCQSFILTKAFNQVRSTVLFRCSPAYIWIGSLVCNWFSVEESRIDCHHDEIVELVVQFANLLSRNFFSLLAFLLFRVFFVRMVFLFLLKRLCCPVNHLLLRNYFLLSRNVVFWLFILFTQQRTVPLRSSYVVFEGETNKSDSLLVRLSSVDSFNFNLRKSKPVCDNSD